jgi:hypothetical protein
MIIMIIIAEPTTARLDMKSMQKAVRSIRVDHNLGSRQFSGANSAAAAQQV